MIVDAGAKQPADIANDELQVRLFQPAELAAPRIWIDNWERMMPRLVVSRVLVGLTAGRLSIQHGGPYDPLAVAVIESRDATQFRDSRASGGRLAPEKFCRAAMTRRAWPLRDRIRWQSSMGTGLTSA